MKRRSDWLIAVAMLIGGVVPFFALMLAFDAAPWAAVVAGFLFWPFAFVGGCVALIGEDV